METLECVRTRRSTRKFSACLVEEGKLSLVLEAGRYAPSGGNSQKCRFFVIRSKELLDELALIAREEFQKMEYDETTYPSIINSIRASKTGNYVFHYNAPILIVVVNEKAYPNHMADSACALQNMMLEANELGLGSCWINQLHWLDENKRIREKLLSIGVKETETVTGALAVGYAEELMRTPKPRTGNEVVFVE